MSKTLLYIGAGILFLIGLCLVGYGVLSVIGSTSSQGQANWLTFGLGFGCDDPRGSPNAIREPERFWS